MADHCVYDGMKTVCDCDTWEAQKDCQFARKFGNRCTHHSLDKLRRCDNPAAQEKAIREYELKSN